MKHLTVTEAAEALNLSVPTIKRYIYDGKLKSAKLPGGQHRIPQSEIERLLTPEGEEPVTEHVPPTVEERLAVIERWLSDIQAEVERLGSGLEVVSSFCERLPQELLPPAAEDAESANRLYILGTGCRKCDQLYELTQEVVAALGRGDMPVERIIDPGDIAAYGPVLTPALVVDGNVVISGRVPSRAVLREMIEQHLEPS